MNISGGIALLFLCGVAVKAGNYEAGWMSVTSKIVNLLAPVSRVERETPGSLIKKVFKKGCCGNSSSLLMGATLQQVEETCEAKYRDVPRNDQLQCISTCIGKEMNLVNDNGEVLKEPFAEKIKSISDKEMHETIDNAVAKCVSRSNAASKEREKKGQKCSCALLRAYFCIIKVINEKCPKNLQTEGKECKA